jgi:hypothetical protein
MIAVQLLWRKSEWKAKSVDSQHLTWQKKNKCI